MREKILIAVKTYPTLSRESAELEENNHGKKDQC